MKIVPSIIMTVAFITLAACSSPTTADKKEEVSITSEPVTQVKEPTVETTTAPEVQEDKVTSINKNDKATIDGYAEVSVSSDKISKKIEPSTPGSYYTYYESKEDDSTYLAIVLKVKNLNTSGTVADELANVTFTFDNQYDYPTFSTVEDKGGQDFTYSNIVSISPLKTATLYYIAEIPNEVAESDKPLKAVIKAKDNTFEYTIR
ncbi:bZIP transcription factor [Paenibacillus xylanexedens]|uniref:DUF4352 domain-containing protein n=1 Tax=Paenibacillus xylanexedens TaxID=528191 RepID=A0ABS4RWA2_PAEXY|nr:bZIP transcription factor [Paenibacillus xylanexedens]MBP2247176.1 hypothetical protein [Paenibacillus xylanexedens]